MNELIRYGLLGVGVGASYGLIAQGLVLLQRAARTLNLAQGALAMVGAYAFADLRDQAGLPVAVAVVGAVAIGAAAGGLAHLLVFRRLQDAAPLTRLIASVGVLLVLQASATLHYGVQRTLLAPIASSPVWEPVSGARVGMDRVLILLVGLAVTGALWFVYRSTHLGRVTTAVAESPATAAGLGHSPTAVASASWALAGGLAALAGALVAPVVGLQPTSLSQMVIPALAAALAGSFVSFPAAFAGGVAVGVLEGQVLGLVAKAAPGSVLASPGWARAVPLVVIAGLLVVRGRTLYGRGEVAPRLPRAVPPIPNRRVVVVATLVAVVGAQILPATWSRPLMVTAIMAVLGLSVVTATGYAGQLTLATFGIAGIGALAAGRAASAWGVGFLPALLIGAGAAGVTGAVVGIPALRTRGPNLAIITLGLGAVLDSVVLSNIELSGGVAGLDIGRRHILGWNVDAVTHLDRYATVTLVVLGLLLLALGNLRRSPTGRALLAVRANERAAASAGIGVRGAKLYAFALSSVLAGVGGVLLTFQTDRVIVENQFGSFRSLTLVALVVVGSVAFPSGAVIGAGLAAGGIGLRLLDEVVALDRYATLAGGSAVIAAVLLSPDGLAANASAHFRRLLPSGRGARGVRRPAVRVERSAVDHVRARRALSGGGGLAVEGLRVTYGGVVAVDGVDLAVDPGEVVGVIGPNGAGKTTLIDAVSGLAPATGSVRLDGRELSAWSPARRARAGLGRSFQGVELFDDLTVAEHLVVGARGRRGAGVLDLVVPPPLALTPDVAEIANDLGLTEVLDRRPGDLSFGQRRSVGMARALVSEPSVLLLDEPAAGLDPAEVEEMARLIVRLAHEVGTAVLLVEHHVAMVMATADRVVVLERGRVLAEGSPDEIAEDRRVVSAYLGGQR